jgi:hypothetical protein
VAPGVPGRRKTVQQHDRPWSLASGDIVDAHTRLDIGGSVLKAKVGSLVEFLFASVRR